jgi:cytidine deaminase
MSENDLMRIATDARLKAYAPYSGFKVGAAALTRSGKVFIGCNVENASYGLTICAERAAIAAAIVAGETDFAAIAVVTNAADPSVSCGACLQVLAEFSPTAKIISHSTSGSQQTFTVDELLPHANQGIPTKHV